MLVAEVEGTEVVTATAEHAAKQPREDWAGEVGWEGGGSFWTYLSGFPQLPDYPRGDKRSDIKRLGGAHREGSRIYIGAPIF